MELFKIHSHWGPTPDLLNQIPGGGNWAPVILKSVKDTPWLLRSNVLKYMIRELGFGQISAHKYNYFLPSLGNRQQLLPIRDICKQHENDLWIICVSTSAISTDRIK